MLARELWKRFGEVLARFGERRIREEGRDVVDAEGPLPGRVLRG